MRRRILSAAFPVHRHSLPQLVVDGVLVALAYFLAYRLRFEDGLGTVNNHRYGVLLTSTIAWVVPVVVAALAAFGAYQRLWTFISQREYEAVVKGAIAGTFVVVVGVALGHPVETPARILFNHNFHYVPSSAVLLPAAAASSAGRTTTVEASWNGSTGVSGWRVLSGPSATSLRPTRAVTQTGFETQTRINAAAYVAVQALDSHGHTLATSPTVHAS